MNNVVLARKLVLLPNQHVSRVSSDLATANDASTGDLATTGNVFAMKRVRRHAEGYLFQNNPYRQDLYPTGARWIVVTTIFEPTKTIKSLVRMKGWCTVIIADAKSLDEEEYMTQLDAPKGSCAVYLTLHAQYELGYSILKYIPVNSFGRKNIGFIFAIHHGAQVIYDTDDDNEVFDQQLMEYWAMHDWRLGSHAFLSWQSVESNPYPVYGAQSVWPRGLPLDLIKNESSYTPVVLSGKVHKPDVCIVQSLANKEPDVDAIYRLTSPKYPVSFENKPTACKIHDGFMSPFNAQATLFFKEAFEFLLLPVTVHGRVSDIWRSYMAQAVMTCSLVFSSPWVEQIRNKHDYLADFQAELPLYTQATAFVQHLRNNSKQYAGLTDVVVDAYEHGIVEGEDVALAFAWQNDLQRAALSQSKTAVQPELFRHLFIVMGRGSHIRNWKKVILNNSSLSHVHMIMGVFDEPVESLQCDEQDKMLCISVQGTTWTSGRNALARAALEWESQRQLKFTYWTFADADIQLSCLLEGSLELQIRDECFSSYDSFLRTINMPVVGTIQLGQYRAYSDSMMSSLEAFDAAFNSFHRDAVKILLPYLTDLDAVTWWSSQALLWFRLRCFAPLYAVAPLHIFYNNPEHNDYPRNKRDRTRELIIGERLLGGLAKILGTPPYDYIELLEEKRINSLHRFAGSDWRYSTDAYWMCHREFSKIDDPVQSQATTRVLVILIGPMRGGHLAWNSLAQQVVRHLSADLAVVSNDTIPEQLLPLVRYIWPIPEYTDWSQPLDAVGCGDQWRQLCALESNVMGGIPYCGQNEGKGSGAMIQASLLEVYNRLTSDGVASQYTHFVLTRADHVYGCPHPFPSNSVMIPVGEDYGGITDRHLVAPREHFLKAVNVSAILCNAASYASRNPENVEILLALFFSDLGLPIERFQRNMFLIRTKTDSTRWSKGDDLDDVLQKFGVLIKYPTELELAKQTCMKTMNQMLQ